MKLLPKMHFSVWAGTLIYFLCGAGWIVAGYLISDQLYAQRETSLFELFKGLGFVAITSLLVFILLGMRRPDTADVEPSADHSTDLHHWLKVRERSQWWLTITVATTVLAIFLTTYFSLEAMRAQTLQHEEDDASTLAYSVAAQIGASLKVVDLILQEAVEHRLQDVDDPDAELQLLQQAADEYVRAIWLLDQDGKIIHDSDTGNIGTDLSDRGYFVRHSEDETIGLFIGDPVVSRSVDSTLVCASRGIRREDGEFLGVACAALDQMQFANFWQLPADNAMVGISLLNEQNEVLLRNSAAQELTKAALNTLVLGNGKPAIHTIEDANGEFSLVAGSNIDAFPRFKVAVQMPLRGRIEEWRTTVSTSMSGLLSVTLIIFGILYLRTRQFRSSAALEQRVISLAHYPMDNINPVLTISAAGEFKFSNPSAIHLLKSLEDAGTQAQFKRSLLELSRQRCSGTSELSIGNKTLLVSTVSVDSGDCNFYLTDVSATRSDESVLKLFYELPFLGMAITSLETKTWVRVNDQLCAILGYPREELTKLTWPEITHPDDLEIDLENFNRILAGNSEGYRMDKRFIRRDGVTIYATIDVRVVRKPSGEINLFVATVQDITERKHAEDLLRLQKNLYATLSAANHAIIRESNREELFHRICQAAIEHAGFQFAWIGQLDESSGMLKPVSVFGDDDGYVKSIRVSANKQDRHGEGPGGRAVRTKKHVVISDVEHDDSVAPWRDDLLGRGVKAFASFPIVVTAEVFGTFSVYAPSADYFADNIVALLNEMTLDLGFALDNIANAQARLQSQKSLEVSEARFRSAIEEAPLPVLIHAEDGEVLSCNRTWLEITGYSLAEIATIGEWTRLAYGEEKALVQEEIDSLYGLVGRKEEGEFHVRCKNGEDRVWDFSSVALGKIADGRRIAMSMASDVTERQQYTEKLKSAFMSTVNVAMSIGEMRDPYTAGHEREVSRIAVAIATEMGLLEDQIEGIRVAGLLHDVGKISIPTEILAKPIRLTPMEFELVKTHVQSSYELLKAVDFPWPVAEIAWEHHERMDGSGYPRGIKGKDILLEARILAVADVVEAMSSHRPYRASLGLTVALEEIQKGAGKLYDENVVAACLRLFREKGLEIKR